MVCKSTSGSNILTLISCPAGKQRWERSTLWGVGDGADPSSPPLLRPTAPLLLGSVDPGHSDVLKDDDDGERQGGRIVIKHGDKVVSGALDEQQPHEECKDTAAHYREPGGRGGGKGAGGRGLGVLGAPRLLPSIPSPTASLQPTLQQAQPCIEKGVQI